ncbi:DNA translocase FtsK [candidate division WWE3 bacterium CG09_land_8_20_14_0_10_47_33]|uniref:DNA translocase FtsK n=1 Tax=candidate division WWE3 bacterium CG_4_9_14_0_2_um_filter_48_10 TaxID=1975078 RepID=A0A2M8EK37_UNCKA|nr:MAG: DNA translocase FtsK [candidate division WWE3 bacterium CG09_land_8_20_14_0_10_47_33]PIZ41601.1 MAG: DNA translocase FtsK [candidate division WWE3 bacterium CG_4_10_14_0_2_um_filter_47_8]PJC23106.1 MAG: DNA translocase FtsK [candidate division WWE3 bacterium CG_4_9_14_0_2_um_filter_48_10]PJE51949.1 MAG: DNA translocase FtsK [candidate division WWE3 bacterium CG10_big_fil_rev_8_21_14_0_10_48_23]
MGMFMARRYRRRGLKLNLKNESFQSAVGVILLVFSVLAILSFFGQAAGFGSALQNLLNRLFGWGVFLVPLTTAVLGLILLRLRVKIPFVELRVFIGLAIFTLALLGFIHLFFPPERAYFEASVLGQGGGLVGYHLQLILRRIFSSIGAFLILASSLVVGILVVFNASVDEALFYISQITKKLGEIIQKYLWRGKRFGREERKGVEGLEEELEKEEMGEEGAIEISTPYLEPTTKAGGVKPPAKWEYPPLSLLNDPPEEGAERGDIEKNAQIIEQTLASFGVKARVADINLGPAVTQYALETERGIKLSAITNLSSDLAMALASKTGTIRIEAPIPGKSQVGVEVPNLRPQLVTLKEILTSEEMTKEESKLAIALGRDVSGRSIVDDITRMPHVLVAGATGSGKSILLRSFIATILFRASPAEVRLILVDPKRVEFSGYNDIPHLLMPAIVEAEKTLPALKWALSEMNQRYRLFQEVGARDIGDFNAKQKEGERLPYLAIIVDELADIMVIAPGEVEKAITRLAQMSRATGLHLLLTTQRPSTDVLTGLIKANIPCRIAFNVTSQVDSRVILDMPGAEKLLGRGDMLYLPPDRSKPIRIQGPFVSNEEMNRLLEFLRNTPWRPEFVVPEEIERFEKAVKVGEPEDPLFGEAVRVVVDYERASASLLQRRLSIGYARAARLLDELEARGIVGPGQGSKPRRVLIRDTSQIL